MVARSSVCVRGRLGGGRTWNQSRVLESWPRKVSPGGTEQGPPHPGLDVLGPAGVGQGVPGLLEGAARWADVGDHHGAAVSPQGVLDGRGRAAVSRRPPPWTLLPLTMPLSHMLVLWTLPAPSAVSPLLPSPGFCSKGHI